MVTLSSKIRVLVLGATGSIGLQTADIIRDYADRFILVGLAAYGRSVEELNTLITEFQPAAVAVFSSTYIPPHPWEGTFFSGTDAVSDLIAAYGDQVDVIVNGIEGISGIRASVCSCRTHARLALANKESIVCAGPLLMKQCSHRQIWPVDSEHSAIAQSLRSGAAEEVSRLILTTSGGAFHGKTRDELRNVTPEQASQHPIWDMGPLITLQSSVMVNKALEILEASLLFSVPVEKIDVTVHPQTAVHSMVTFTDGATITQCGHASMRVPIAYALTGGERLPGLAKSLSFDKAQQWEFYPVDTHAFPAIELARRAARYGGLVLPIFCAAAEVACHRFLQKEISFLGISACISWVLDKTQDPDGLRFCSQSMTEEAIYAALQWGQSAAVEYTEHSLDSALA